MRANFIDSADELRMACGSQWADPRALGWGIVKKRGGGERFLRLPFCALTPAEIDEGIRRLAMAVAAVREPT